MVFTTLLMWPVTKDEAVAARYLTMADNSAAHCIHRPVEATKTVAG